MLRLPFLGFILVYYPPIVSFTGVVQEGYY